MTISFKINYINSYASQVSLISSYNFWRYLHLKWCHFFWDTLYNKLPKKFSNLSKVMNESRIATNGNGIWENETGKKVGDDKHSMPNKNKKSN